MRKFKYTIKKIIRALLCLWIYLLIITPRVNALTISSNYMGYSVGDSFVIGPNNYISDNTSLVVDSGSDGNYLAIDLCSTIGNDLTISNISNQSGNVSFYKSYNLGISCSAGNYQGDLVRIFYNINQWADAGNGNFGLIFNSRFYNNATYNGIFVVKAINILGSLNLEDALLENIDSINSNITNIENNLNNSINDSTNTITDSIGQTEDNINQNIDDMEQSIVDSNKETQDVIKDQFNDCRESVNLFNINGEHSTVSGGSYKYDFYLKPNTYYTLSSNIPKTTPASLYLNGGNSSSNNVNNSQSRTIFTGSDGYLFVYVRYEKSSSGNDFDLYSAVKNGEYYIQLQEGKIATDYELYGEEICSNKIDDTNNNLNNIDNSLNSTDTPDIDLSDLDISSDEPISDLLTMPLTLVTSYYNALSSTCVNYQLPFFFGNTITFECFTIGDYVGSTYENIIDMAICLFMVYEMALLFIRMFDGMTTLADTYTWIVKRGG